MQLYSKFLKQKKINLLEKSNYTDDFDYFKDAIFLRSLVYINSLSIYILIPGIIYGISINNLFVAIWDTIIYLIIYSLTYLKKVKLIIRKWIFVSSIYMLGLQLLIELGMDGAGILFIIIGNITSSLIFNKIQLLYISIVNIFIYFYIGYIIYTGNTTETFSYSLNIYDWFIISIHNIYLSIILSAILNELLAVLKKALSKEKKIQVSLENTTKKIFVSNEILRKKNVQLAQIAFVTAQELRNPLLSVAENLLVFSNNIDNKLDEKGKKYLFFAKDGVERMERLINGMIELAKIDQHTIQNTEIQLKNLLVEIFNKYNTRNVKAQLIVTISNEIIINDNDLVIKLFSVLFSNSFNYYKKETKLIIQISLSELNENNWEFAFADNGIGIEGVYFERIFQIYQRLHRQSEYPGQGIGLAIAKRIISKLNGQIKIDSTIHVGTRVTIILPKNNKNELDFSL